MTKCKHCGRRWTSLVQAHCGCCRHFTKVATFDIHRDVERDLCRDPETIKRRDGSPVLVAREDEFGVVWGRAGARPGAEFRRRAAERAQASSAAPTMPANADQGPTHSGDGKNGSSRDRASRRA